MNEYENSILDASHDTSDCWKVDTKDSEPVVSVGESRSGIIGHECNIPANESAFYVRKNEIEKV